MSHWLRLPSLPRAPWCARAAFCLSLALLLPPAPAGAAWTSDGLAICTAPGLQSAHASVPDGAGGVISVWQDSRAGNWDIYAQRTLGSGIVAPSWPVNGRAVATGPARQSMPAVVADGAGGVFVGWQETDEATGYSLGSYLQHVEASGELDADWPADGAPLLFLDPNVLGEMAGLADGAGGLYVAWPRSSSQTITVHHVVDGGVVDPAWPYDGVGLFPSGSMVRTPFLLGDGSGGVVVMCSRTLSYGRPDTIFAQRVIPAGEVAWAADGVPIAISAPYWEGEAISDGEGGAFLVWDQILWLDRDVCAQHLLSSGVPEWPLTGVAVCTAYGYQEYPVAAIDGAGGLLVAWSDDRYGHDESQGVFAQHVLTGGGLDPAWPVGGRQITGTASDSRLGIVSDLAGGALVTWCDNRIEPKINYAQRVLGNGALDPAWPSGGLRVCATSSFQVEHRAVPNGAGGVIVTWSDYRAVMESDLYAQNITSSGAWVTAAPAGSLAPLALEARVGPNPTRDRTHIRLGLPRPGAARVAIHDVSGRLVRLLLDGASDAGVQTLPWDGRDASGAPVASGLYFVRIEFEGHAALRRLAVAR